MSVAARMKESSSAVLGVAMFFGMLVIPIALLIGAATFSVWVLKWTFPAFAITFLISLFLLAPLAVIPPARSVSAAGFLIASFVFAAILWLWGMAYTYEAWGFIGVIVGLLFFGGGVVLLAMFAALVHADWGNLGVFVVTAALIVGYRVLARWLAEKADQRAARLNPSEITLQAYEIRE